MNVFETTKTPGVEYTGFKLDIGASFTAQVQDTAHENTATPLLVGGIHTNKLADIGFGFNNSTANLYLNAQLAPGIRVALTSYLSSRHHNETWVKDGYIQMDESPIDTAALELFADRHGPCGSHGDQLRRCALPPQRQRQCALQPVRRQLHHGRFTTEVGGEVYLKTSSVVAMGAITGGEIRGTVVNPGQRGPAFIGKLGYDRQFNEDLRMRVTGSLYKTDKAASNTLYGGDRAGSRYYWAMENVQATETAQAFPGLINPGFRNKVTAFQFNPFVKCRGIEVFGVIEQADGKASAETVDRTWNQCAVDAVYRFTPGEKLFVGVRYNKAEGDLVGIADKVGADQVAGRRRLVHPARAPRQGRVREPGCFGYPPASKLNGGRFSGLMLEGVVAF